MHLQNVAIIIQFSCWPFSARAPPLLYPASSFKSSAIAPLAVSEVLRTATALERKRTV